MDEQTPPSASAEAVPAEPRVTGATEGAGYRIALDIYSGPLDLLLYLIRKEEVDIYDIPIARIAEQYQRHIELMAEINVNVAGEFLVMAATLMEIKLRMLLPTEQGTDDDEEEDPRAELVRQLLEYKRYKDLARELAARATEQARRFPRPGKALPTEPEGGSRDEVGDFLGGIGLWDLLNAFSKVLSETRLGPPQERVLEHQRPIHVFQQELLRLLEAEGRVVFSRVFAACTSRDEAIGMFIALLELTRLHRVVLQQAAPFAEIYVCPAEQAGTLEPVAPPVAEPSPPPEPSRGTARPLEIKTLDVMSQIEESEEEAESLGRARERIDIALERVEAFLKQHHQQVLERQGGDTGDEEAGETTAENGEAVIPAVDGGEGKPAEKGDIGHASEGPALDQHQQP